MKKIALTTLSFILSSGFCFTLVHADGYSDCIDDYKKICAKKHPDDAEALKRCEEKTKAICDEIYNKKPLCDDSTGECLG